MSYFHRLGFVKTLSSLTLTLPLLMGCGEQTVRPSVDLVDRSTKALSLGSFLEVNGVYGAGCTNRAGSWSADISGAGLLTNPALDVVKNDTGCTLSASSVRIGSTMASSLYSPAADLALGASFASSGSAFRQLPGDPVAFYSNMQIQPDVSFAADFVVRIVYSEDPNAVSASRIASYVVQSATAIAGAVVPPDYSVDLTGLTMQVDASKIVQAVSGNAILLPAGVIAQTFVLSASDLGATPSYAAVDTEFQAGMPANLTGVFPTIAAASFSLVGADLSMAQIRSLVIANDVAGTRSYQVFRISFSAP